MTVCNIAIQKQPGDRAIDRLLGLQFERLTGFNPTF
jgi:hypothetical protein